MKLDQFYTKQVVAKECLDELKNICDLDTFDILFEPSAGSGSFYNLLPLDLREGIDLDPKHSEIKKQNFFDYTPISGKRYATIGNPPFGRVCSLAIKFFNKAAEFSDVIAFIIPRTFKRVSVQNKLDLNFELIFNKDLPINECFEPKMGAKCCFQVWRKTSSPRKKARLQTTHSDFEFMKLGPKDENNQPTPPENADFVIKAYGSNCGEVKTGNLETLRPKSWHWIKSNVSVDVLVNKIKCIDFGISKDTVRQDSIGKAEVVKLYSEYK